MFVAYKFRFAVLLSFCLVTAANAIMWISFAPISSLAQQFFQVQALEINALSICFMAIYLPGTMLSMFIFNRYSLRTGLLVGAFMTAVGAWVRFASAYSPTSEGKYGGVLFGQCLAGLAQPFFTNIPAKVAARWFPVRERDLATAVSVLFNPIGIAIGSLLGSEFVTVGNIVEGMQDWLLVQAIVATVAAVMSLALFRDKPPTPASQSQETTVFRSTEEEAHNKPFAQVCRESLEQVKDCFREPAYCFLFCAFAIGLGIFNSLTTLVEQLTRPSCAAPNDASTFGGLLIGLGLVGSIAVGYWTDRSHKYQLVLRLGFGAAVVLTLALTLSLQPNQLDLIAALFALLGLVMLPMLPTAFSAAAEATFPVSEDVSTGMLMLSGQITGIAFIFGLDALAPIVSDAELAVICSAAEQQFTYPGSSILILVCVASSFGFILAYKETHKRLRVDDDANAVLVNLKLDSGKS